MKVLFFSSLVVACTLLSAGCGIEPETLDSVREVIRTASASSAEQQPEVVQAAVFEFQPPYPERIDPFTFPANPNALGDDPGTSITSAAQIVVLGFADVEGPRVFLSNKGRTVSLAVGDSIHGVEVIGIHPPAVDLRQGTLQWRATMFDKQAAGRD